MSAVTSLSSRILISSGHFLFRVRNALFPIIFVLVLVLTRPAHFLGDPQLDRLVMLIGAAIALLGQAFRMFVIGYAYIVRGGKNRKVYANDLVVAGLYAHSRNPMYVGNFLIACGVGIVFGSLWIYVAVIPFFAFVYLAITAAEEEYLSAKFGEAYADYMKRVNRFWPNFRGLGESLRGHPYRWRTVLSKEHGTIFGTTAGMVAIVIWKYYRLYGWPAECELILRLALLFIPLVAIYVTIRVLKKLKRLHEPKATAADE